MNCPFKMANPGLTPHWSHEEGSYTGQDCGCEKTNCELWNEHFGKCSLAIDAYIKGIEDYRKEFEAERRLAQQ